METSDVETKEMRGRTTAIRRGVKKVRSVTGEADERWRSNWSP